MKLARCIQTGTYHINGTHDVFQDLRIREFYDVLLSSLKKNFLRYILHNCTENFYELRPLSFM